MRQQNLKKTKLNCSTNHGSKGKSANTKYDHCLVSNLSEANKAYKNPDISTEYDLSADKTPNSPCLKASHLSLEHFYRAKARAKQLRAEANRLEADAIEDELQAWLLENGSEVPPSTPINPELVSKGQADANTRGVLDLDRFNPTSDKKKQGLILKEVVSRVFYEEACKAQSLAGSDGKVNTQKLLSTIHKQVVSIMKRPYNKNYIKNPIMKNTQPILYGKLYPDKGRGNRS